MAKAKQYVQPEINWEENVAIRDEAINTALTAADEKLITWSATVKKALNDFIKMVPDFITEDFREYCESIGVPQPPEKRAYGGIIQGASREGLIKPTGEYRPMKSKNCHMNPKRVWSKA